MEKQYYLFRGDKSGVFFGELGERNGQEVVIKNVRNIWYWDGANSLMQMAQEGVKNPKKCKFTVWLDEIIITDCIQVLLCTEKAAQIIKEVPEWK